MIDTDELSGRILIAMPEMSDPRFERAVILICAHSEDGAMGIVLNHPMRDLGFAKLAKQLGLDAGPDLREVSVRMGGPVEPARGFVLHDGEADGEGTLAVGEGISMTTTRDILEDLARGQGPDHALLALGYAGWSGGQLEAEIMANGWLVGDLPAAAIFADPHDLWTKALRAMGVDPRLLSSGAGHA